MFEKLDPEIIERPSKDFPIQLYDLKECPNKLYVIGNKKLLENFSIAIVGARDCSDKSEETARKISYDLSKNGVQIVSGLARGIDRVAHEACLEAGGKTIAVLGGGFNNLYPKENIKLLYNILEKNGLIITEYAPNIPCFKQNFIARNRIIAALSQGIIIIEAKEKSGSLITARYGFKMNRKIFSCPGDMMDSRYSGSNKLLTDYAKCALSYEDIIKAYPDLEISPKKIKKNAVDSINIPREYLNIYNKLADEGKSIDELKRILNISIGELNSKLTLMEIDRICKKGTWKIF